MITITEAGSEVIKTSTARGKDTPISVQGDEDDFVWTLEKSLNEGGNWEAVKDSAGETEFTGSHDISIKAVTGGLYRVTVSDMGNATSVIIASQ